MNNDDDDKNSVVLKLEVLNKRYETLLADYSQTQKEYVDFLQDSPSTSFGEVEGGYAFYGTKPLQTTTSSSKDTCAAVCASLDGCTGGTFNTKTLSCALVAGDGTLKKSNDNADIAIMHQYKIYLEKLQLLNAELGEVNQAILTAISAGQNIYDEQDKHRLRKAEVLRKNYGTLSLDKENIARSLQQIQEMSNEESESALRVKSAYYSFILVFFIILNIFAIIITPNSNLFFLFFIEFLIFMFYIRY
jgi:hypothetical protein